MILTPFMSGTRPKILKSKKTLAASLKAAQSISPAKSCICSDSGKTHVKWWYTAVATAVPRLCEKRRMREGGILAMWRAHVTIVIASRIRPASVGDVEEERPKPR